MLLTIQTAGNSTGNGLKIIGDSLGSRLGRATLRVLPSGPQHLSLFPQQAHTSGHRVCGGQRGISRVAIGDDVKA